MRKVTVVGGNLYGMWLGQAFLDESGKFQPLGTLGGYASMARAINESGTIVGYPLAPIDHNSWWSSHDPVHAMIFTDGRMFDLNDLTDHLGKWHLEGCPFR